MFDKNIWLWYVLLNNKTYITSKLREENSNKD